MHREVHLLLEHLDLDHQLGLGLLSGVLALLLDTLELSSEGLEGGDLGGQRVGELLGLHLRRATVTSTFSSSPKKVDSFSRSSDFLGDVICNLLYHQLATHTHLSTLQERMAQRGRGLSNSEDNNNRIIMGVSFYCRGCVVAREEGWRACDGRCGGSGGKALR